MIEYAKSRDMTVSPKTLKFIVRSYAHAEQPDTAIERIMQYREAYGKGFPVKEKMFVPILHAYVRQSMYNIIYLYMYTEYPNVLFQFMTNSVISSVYLFTLLMTTTFFCLSGVTRPHFTGL